MTKPYSLAEAVRVALRCFGPGHGAKNTWLYGVWLQVRDLRRCQGFDLSGYWVTNPRIRR